MPGSEFGALHQAAQTAGQYLGKLKAQLMEWDRKFDIYNNKYKGRVAKTPAEVLDALAHYETAIPNLEKMEAAAKKDNTVEQEDAFNFEIVFSRYKEKWESIMLPFMKPIIKKEFKFKTVAEMKAAIAAIKQLLKEESLKKRANKAAEETPAKDASSQKIIKIHMGDASFASVTNTLSGQDAPSGSRKKIRLTKKISKPKNK